MESPDTLTPPPRWKLSPSCKLYILSGYDLQTRRFRHDLPRRVLAQTDRKKRRKILEVFPPQHRGVPKWHAHCHLPLA